MATFEITQLPDPDPTDGLTLEHVLAVQVDTVGGKTAKVSLEDVWDLFKPYIGQYDSNTTLTAMAIQYAGIESTTLAGGTITLPASPQEGDRVYFKDEDDDAASNNVTIGGNGKNIDGAATFTMNADGQSFMLMYANGEWRIF